MQKLKCFCDVLGCDLRKQKCSQGFIGQRASDGRKASSLASKVHLEVGVWVWGCFYLLGDGRTGCELIREPALEDQRVLEIWWHAGTAESETVSF
jgi:hypothetical protein